jgi:hypothetical protein
MSTTTPSALSEDVIDEPMLRFFQYDHLPPALQAASAGFCRLAYEIVGTQPRTPERTVCLRKLLEAKDCAVRNLLPLV